jgi:propanol-preferring alcohol dehydrogenase
MKAMVLEKTMRIVEDRQPLALRQRPKPEPAFGQVLVKVSACGVCHTELDEIEGRAAPDHFPVIPGHQVVGTVVELGAGVATLAKGDRVEVAWIYPNVA